MGKPLVVVVEPDESYLSPLEWRISENLYETVDLEFISDKEYLEEYFRIPRTIELLIIDDGVFRQEFLRHNIKKVFILSEEMPEGDIRMQEPGGQAEMQVTYVFKYMNLQTLTGIVIPPEWNGGHKEQKGTQLVAVLSAEGGAGSTTLAIGVSACLRQGLKKVLYLNLQPYQSFQYLMEDEEELSVESGNRLRSGGPKVYTDLKAQIKNEMFFYLPQLTYSGYAMGISDESYLMMIQAARQSGDFDYIVLDLGTHLTNGMVSLLEKVNKGIIVTRQWESSHHKLKTLLKNINVKDREKFIFVCNCFDETEENYCKKSNVATITEYIEKFLECPGKAKTLASVGSLQKLAYALM